MELVFLGTSAGAPTVFRGLPSVALRFDDGSICLLDCGEGTQRQMMRCNVSFMSVERIIISHFHCDHHMGLSGLLQTMNLNSREKSIEIIGPKGTKELVEHVLEPGYFRLGFDIMVCEVGDKDTLDLGKYTIKTIENNHCKNSLSFCIEEPMRKGRFNLQRAEELGIPEGPLYRKLQNGESVIWNGKRIEPDAVLGPPRKGRKICYSGDTAYFEPLSSLAKECDVLIHEATFSEEERSGAETFKHSTATDAAKIARLAHAKKLFLTHISGRYGVGKTLEKEAIKIFPNTTIAEDLMRYDVRYPE
ncbi:MAG: ribonuclease Z [Candidatus Thermoplasmatota archaeon]|nr:ribonuclease Z [Candidatus Thermoplasmatota archaeon]